MQMFYTAPHALFALILLLGGCDFFAPVGGGDEEEPIQTDGDSFTLTKDWRNILHGEISYVFQNRTGSPVERPVAYEVGA